MTLFKTFCIFNSPGVPGVVQNISQVRAHERHDSSFAGRWVRKTFGSAGLVCGVMFGPSCLQKVSTSNILQPTSTKKRMLVQIKTTMDYDPKTLPFGPCLRGGLSKPSVEPLTCSRFQIIRRFFEWKRISYVILKKWCYMMFYVLLHRMFVELQGIA